MRRLKMCMLSAPLVLLVLAVGLPCWAQLLKADPVVAVKLLADRNPAIAGEQLTLAAVLEIEPGWHVNSNDPGDEFLIPTSVDWRLPEGWPAAETAYPPGSKISFPFSEEPLDVWEDEVVMLSSLVVPQAAAPGELVLRAVVTAQACNNTQCLAPEELRSRVTLSIGGPGVQASAQHEELFESARQTIGSTGQAIGSGAAGEDAEAARLAALPLPVLFITVFLAGLALNLLPCVYPLIPITVGFFTQQNEKRAGGAFILAMVYVLGMAITYSSLGVLAALTGAVFGSALGNPIVIGVIVVVILALSTSMFGLWELRVPGWAMRASGGRGGLLGALVMGLVVGFLAAPCIGPFVLGLLTFVGQSGSPLLGFGLFFTLAIGLGVPYLVLGTFTGMLSRLPAAGGWMVGIKKAFGVLLLAMAVYFAGPLLPDQAEAWTMALILVGGGLYLLVIDRTGHEIPAIDRIMRFVATVLIIAGVVVLPFVGIGHQAEEEWRTFEQAEVEAAIASGQPVIIDYAADWCIPCRELEKITFADPAVAKILASFARFKSDQTTTSERSEAEANAYAARGVPTVIVFRDGAEAFRVTGFEGPEVFLERLQGANGGP